jgi:hypothetical protein
MSKGFTNPNEDLWKLINDLGVREAEDDDTLALEPFISVIVGLFAREMNRAVDFDR